MGSSSRLRNWYRLVEAVHVTALGVWLGALVMAGITAAIVFPTMRALEPDLPNYAGYKGSHADLAAGMVQNKVFFAADVIQFGAGLLSLATIIGLIAFLGLPLRRISTGVRLVGLGAALGLASFWLMVLAPRMQTETQAYWRAAEAGDTAAAQTHRAAFEEDHPVAANIMTATALSVLVALGGGAFSAAGGRREAESSEAAPKSDLEEPSLARRGGGQT